MAFPPAVCTAQQAGGGLAGGYWRRALFAWVVLTLVIMAVAAEPAADFPKAQLGSVPAAGRCCDRRCRDRAGVPVVLAILP